MQRNWLSHVTFDPDCCIHDTLEDFSYCSEAAHNDNNVGVGEQGALISSKGNER